MSNQHVERGSSSSNTADVGAVGHSISLTPSAERLIRGHQRLLEAFYKCPGVTAIHCQAVASGLELALRSTLFLKPSTLAPYVAEHCSVCADHVGPVLGRVQTPRQLLRTCAMGECAQKVGRAPAPLQRHLQLVSLIAATTLPLQLPSFTNERVWVCTPCVRSCHSS